MAHSGNKKDRDNWGPTIATFRVLRGGWTQSKLARRAGMDRSRISIYEAGVQVPGPPIRERLAEAARIPWLLVEPIRTFIRLFRNALASGVSPEPPATWEAARPLEEAQRAVWDIVERTVTLARAELSVHWSTRAARKPGPPTEDDLARAESLCTLLLSFDGKEQRLLVEGSEEYKDWLICILLCDKSEKAAPHSASEALDLAELARHVARHIADTGLRPRLEGYAEHFVANALRVGNQLQAAEAAIVRGWSLWRAGTDKAGLLDEGRLLDLQASLRRAQRRFSEALKLHDQALAVAQQDQQGAILLNKSVTLGEKGDNAGSIETLRQAAHTIDEYRQPRLLFSARFNLAANLVRLGRAAEAVPIIAETRALAEKLRNDTDLVRLLWLESLAFAGLGRAEEAVAGLERVRRDLEARSLPYDFALASLDLALLYRDQGRPAEVVELAVEMLKLFEAAGVHREALAAVILFRDAAEKGEVTVELVRRLQDDLKKAQRDTKLPFEA